VPVRATNSLMLHVLAALFALAAIVLLAVAIVGMIQKRWTDRTGYLLCGVAVACFAVAVVLNVVSRS
jgi:surface polysaccharide O-acyltransferase-like enzyme